MLRVPDTSLMSSIWFNFIYIYFKLENQLLVDKYNLEWKWEVCQFEREI